MQEHHQYLQKGIYLPINAKRLSPGVLLLSNLSKNTYPSYRTWRDSSQTKL